MLHQAHFDLKGGLLSFAAGAGMISVMVRISARQVRYQRGAFEDWLAARVGIRPVCPLCRA
jgi:hypothetical protein